MSIEHAPRPAGHRLLGRRQLREMIPNSDMSIWRWEKEGKFPQHVNINGRNFWNAVEVEQWIENHLAKREAGHDAAA